MLRVRWGSKSITGNYRENNEDRCLCHPQGRYFLVADGMGGQSAGEKASAMAVELVPQLLDRSLDFERANVGQAMKVIDEAVARANAEIMALGNLDIDFHNMGTTLAFVVAVGDELLVGGLGDSRVYQLRGGVLTQLTTDHSLTQALLDAGTITPEEAVNHRYRNVLYKYLGSKEGGSGTQPKRITPQKGDRYLICSDGVSDGVKGDSLRDLLKAGADPQQTAETVVKAALDGGSKDNITCVVVFVEGA